MTLDFRAVDLGDGTGGSWAAWGRGEWPSAAHWGDGAPADAVARFGRHFPELAPVLERLAAELDRPGAAQLLTHIAARPFWSACTQRAVAGELLRNYDFDPAECCRTVLRSEFLRPVLGMGEGLWGLLDGMNDAGLAVSLTYGGRRVFRPGPSVLIVVRYLLETCTSVGEALAALRRVPVATAQNLTLVDGGRAATVFVGPDLGEPLVAEDGCATNHQHLPVPEEWERDTATGARLAAVRAAGATPEAVRDALLRPPLLRPDTLYTAHYRPAAGAVTYLWPGGERWEKSLAGFTEGRTAVRPGPR